MQFLKIAFLIFLVGCSVTKPKPAANSVGETDVSPATTTAVASWVPTYNIKDFGALGLGVASLHQDSLALWQAVETIRKERGGKLLIPQGLFAFSGNGIVLPDNIEIILQGEIRHVNPNDSKFFEGTIFYLNTYTATSEMDDEVPKFFMLAAKKGDTFITLTSAEPLGVGEVVLIGGNLQPVPGKADHFYFATGELNSVKSISGNKVYLKYPVSINITSSPALVRINSGSSYTSPLKVADRVAQNVYIHGQGKLSQADKDEVHNLPLFATVKPRCVIMGGGFECRIVGISTQSHGALPSGNMYSRCLLDSIKATAEDKCFDAGYNTHNSTFSNLITVMLPFADTNALISLNQGGHDITITNYRISGGWTGSKLMNVNYTNFLTVRNFTIALPAFEASKGIAVSANASNVLIDGCTIAVKRLDNISTVETGAKNVVIRNVIKR